MVNLALDIDFDFDGFSTVQNLQKTQAIKSRALAYKSKIYARRAKSEAILAEILPERMAMGESWHVISSGDIDSLSYLAHLIKNNNMRYVALSTWCMALDDVKTIAEWVASGKIERLDAYVGEIFPGQYPEAYEALKETCKSCNGRVAVFKNHSKLFLCKTNNDAWCIESSANINTNPRTENTCITGSFELFEHHKSYFDEIKAFNRDFDDWKPFVTGAE